MVEQLESFFEDYKIKIPAQSSRSFMFDCPACGGKRKLYMQKSNGMSACFKQGSIGQCPRPGSTHYYALSLITGLPLGQIKDYFLKGEVKLSEDFTVSFESRKEERKSLEPIAPDDFPSDLSFPSMPLFDQAEAYLYSRGITDDIIKKYNITFWISKRRVIFPVIMNGLYYGWQGRAIDPVDKAYRMYNLPGEWKSRSLMFYDNIVKKDFAILAEGPISALKFEKVGHFVASMGKEVSKEQLKLLADSGIKKLFLALDRDAHYKNNEIRFSMTQYEIPCYIIPVPDHRDDFGDSTYEECAEAFTKAYPALDSGESGDWNVKF